MMLVSTSFLAARWPVLVKASVPVVQAVRSGAGGTSQPRQGADRTRPDILQSARPRN